MEIGRHLAEAKAACVHGEWLLWLESEFGWSEDTARSYMRVYDAFGKSGTVPDLGLPMRSLHALATPSTPAPARQEVIADAEAGETLTRAKVDALFAKAFRMWMPAGPNGCAGAQRRSAKLAQQVGEFVEQLQCFRPTDVVECPRSRFGECEDVRESPKGRACSSEAYETE
ncbi:MAG: DUF3102 domain-containing protein [Methylobacteriaceae bacterium]|nr:DUF3102 domain-containing protein [Methylobacteriaceae bacterium]